MKMMMILPLYENFLNIETVISSTTHGKLFLVLFQVNIYILSF